MNLPLQDHSQEMNIEKNRYRSGRRPRADSAAPYHSSMSFTQEGSGNVGPSGATGKDMEGFAARSTSWMKKTCEQALMLGSSGVPVVLQAMRQHPSVPSVQDYGCETPLIQQLSGEQPEAK